MAKSVKHEIPKNGAQKIATALVAAKKAEAVAKGVRMDLEDKLLAHPSIKKHLTIEGTVNFAVKDGDAIKVACKLNRNVDQDMAKGDEWSSLPIEIRETCFRWKAEVVLSNLRALEKMDVKTFRKVQKFFTTTAGRSTISVTASQ